MIRMNKNGQVVRLLDRVEQAYVERGLAQYVDAGELEAASRRGGRRAKPAKGSKGAKASVVVDEAGNATVDGAPAKAGDAATAKVIEDAASDAGEASGG
jgi:tRNA(Ile2) C34 agmatinyltransferase TiaS